MSGSLGIPLESYRLALPAQVVFGWGAREQAPELVRRLGQRAWIVCGSRTLTESGVVNRFASGLTQAGIQAEVLTTISREPLVEDVDRTTSDLLERTKSSGDVLIGLGGGAALDLAKAVSAMATNRHGDSVRDFLEGVGSGLSVDQRPLPMLAMPTTAGTGTEATRNAVISSPDPLFKKSLRSELMVPDAVIIDPELAVSCPPSVTAHSGMDAITQLIESYISCRSQPFTAGLCIEGLQRAVPALPRAVQEGSDQAARTAMAHAAFLSGVALANSGLGMAHGVAAALGVHCDVAHGLACAVMLRTALQTNREVSESRLATLERVVSGDDIPSDAEAADRFIGRICDLCDAVGIPQTLSELGVNEEDISDLVAASRGNSMSGNPQDLNDSGLHQILHRVLR